MSQPNIVLIFSDQHRPDWMGCAGHPFVRTPNLDAMAERGTRFTNAHSTYPLCAPARMSFLTGLHPYRNAVYVNEHTLRSDTPTFVHGLGMAGYETVLAGRMHFMGPDQRHGFEKRLVGDICRCYGGGPRTDWGPLAGAESSAAKHRDVCGPAPNPVLDYDTAVTDAAVEFMRTRAASGEKRPLFINVGWYDPHPPFACSEQYYNDALADMADLDRVIPVSSEPRHPFVQRFLERQKFEDNAPEKTHRMRANYAGMIRYLDDLVGRVIESARSLPGETLFIYTSDHGELAGDHGMFGKGNFYEQSIKVPLIFAPLTDEVSALDVPRGQTVDVPTTLIDLAPTLIAATGAPELPVMDGRDLAPLLAGEDAGSWAERPVFAESELVILGYPVCRMVRRGPFKFIYYHGMPPELFNIDEDPAEQRNLAREDEYADLCAELEALVLEDWDPEEVLRDHDRRMAELQYMTNWGRQVGMGPVDLWDQEGYARQTGGT